MSRKENIAIILALFASSMLMTAQKGHTPIYLVIILLLVVLTAIVMIVMHKDGSGLLKAKTFSSKLGFEVKYTDENGEVMIAGETPGKIRIPRCDSRRFIIHTLDEENLDDYIKEIRRKKLKRVIITSEISQEMLEKITSGCQGLKIFDFIAGEINDYVCLSKLKKLVHLGISNCKNISSLPSFGFREIESFELDEGEILTDISALSDSPGIKSLVLNNCPRLTDISVIEKFDNLYHLNLYGLSGLSDLTSAIRQQELLSLNLGKCNNITDLSLIQPLKCLQELQLEEWNHFSVSQPLELMPALRIFSAPNSSDLKDLSWLKNQSKLKDINLLGCENLEDISELSSMEELVALKIDSIKIKNFAPLSMLESLEYLEMEKCHHLTSADYFANMPRLSYLEMNECHELADISSLAELKCLNQLIMPECGKLTDISALSKLSEIIGINLQGAELVEDLSPLKKLYSLRYLNLMDCKNITDLSHLAKLKSLLFLDLSGCNRIADLSPLAGLSNLRQLDMIGWDNPNCKNPLPYLPELGILDISKSRITNLELLSQQTEVETLSLSACDELKDISGIAVMKRLDILRLDLCSSLADISPLTKLTCLTCLDLRDNDNLFYILPLKEMTSLQLLYLGNEKKFHFTDIETICRALPYCKVFVQTKDSNSGEREYSESGEASGKTQASAET